MKKRKQKKRKAMRKKIKNEGSSCVPGWYCGCPLFTNLLPKHPQNYQNVLFPKIRLRRIASAGLLRGRWCLLYLQNLVPYNRLVGGLTGKNCFVPILQGSNWCRFCGSRAIFIRQLAFTKAYYHRQTSHF